MKTYFKNKTASVPLTKNLKRVINILSANPGRIQSVIEKRKVVVLKGSHGAIEPLRFDKADFPRALQLIKEEIKTRPNPMDRVESWECEDVDGVFSYRVWDGLLRQRQNNSPRKKAHINRRKLLELTSRYGLGEHMAELFLAELRLSDGKSESYKLAESIGLTGSIF